MSSTTMGSAPVPDVAEQIQGASESSLTEWVAGLPEDQHKKIEEALAASKAETPEIAVAGGEDSPTIEILIKRLTEAEPLKLNVKPGDTVADIKSLIQESLGISSQEQKLLRGRKALEEEATSVEEYGITEGTILTLLVIEIPQEEKDMTTWDVEGNERREQLCGDGNVLTCPGLRQDYISIVTKEPIRQGRHYFQFLMHNIEDEEWCGVTPLPDQANANPYPTSLKGWLYYCGRMRGGGTAGGLQFMVPEGAAVASGQKTASKTKPSGDRVGMYIDLDEGCIAFDLNGDYQGADIIPIEPLWIITTVDRPGDKVEVQKRPLSEIPLDSMSMCGRKIKGCLPLSHIEHQVSF